MATRAALLRGRAALALARGDDQTAAALHVEALRRRQLLGDNRAIVEELEALAIIAVRRGDSRRAATLLGATDRWRSATGLPVAPRDEPRRAAAVGALADVGAALDEAWQTGRGLSVDEAVSLALAVEPGSG